MEIHIYENTERLDIWRVKDCYPIPNIGDYIHIAGFTNKKIVQRIFGEHVITLKVEKP